MGNIINGKEIRSEIINKALKKGGSFQSLRIIQVGERKDSSQYVRNKIKYCEEAGINVELIKISADQEKKEIKKEIIENIPVMNGNWCIVQLPIPGFTKQEEEILLDLIPYQNDLDSLSSKSKKKFYSANTLEDALKFAPLTPFGIIKIFERENINLLGKVVCVIGKSEIVGRPLTRLLTLASATVISCNSKTSREDLIKLVNISDIVISAAGVPHLINDDFNEINFSDKILIDVGTNFIDNEFVGDIDKNIKEKSFKYTPVPGGVGPVTIASVIEKIIR